MPILQGYVIKLLTACRIGPAAAPRKKRTSWRKLKTSSPRTLDRRLSIAKLERRLASEDGKSTTTEGSESDRPHRTYRVTRKAVRLPAGDRLAAGVGLLQEHQLQNELDST